MTAHVVVMNRLGATFAADSAVTLSQNGKAYNNADKLFPLGEHARVAIANFGVASFMGSPWDLVIKSYAAKLGDRRLSTLREYRDDFVAFLDSEHPLFDASAEKDSYAGSTSDYLSALLDDAFSRHGVDVTAWAEDAWETVRTLIAIDEANWTYGTMPGFDEDFGRRAREQYKAVIANHFEHFFDGVDVPQDVLDSLNELIDRMYTQAWTSPSHRSGILIVGFGEAEYYPGCIHLEVGSRVLGRTRWLERDHVSIERENGGVILPFAKHDMVQSFIHGMPVSVFAGIAAIVREEFERLSALAPASMDKSASPNQSDVVQAVMGKLRSLLSRQFADPVVSAVAALPTAEMAELARNLVSLEVLRCKFAVEETGCVGGEVRVGLLTKHEGFSWVRTAA